MNLEQILILTITTVLISIILLITLIIVILLIIFIINALSNPKDIPLSEIKKDGGKYIILKNKRVIEYFEMGDKEGRVLLLFGGFGLTSKFFNINYYQKIFKKLNLHVYAISLPGFGYTSYYRRSLIDWGDDIKEFLNILKIDKFSVVGYRYIYVTNQVSEVLMLQRWHIV
jgi:hypothetical protein